jgi:hypothetical protein
VAVGGGRTESKHLLSGFVRCGACGGSIVQSWRAECSLSLLDSWTRGRAVCANTLTVPQSLADLTVLRAIERDVLDPDVVEAAFVLSLDDLTRWDVNAAAHRDELRDKLGRLEAELARYASAIADAGPLDMIVAAIKVREQRCEAIRRGLHALPSLKLGVKDASEIRSALKQYLGDWTAMARAGVAEARPLLRNVLVHRLLLQTSRKCGALDARASADIGLCRTGLLQRSVVAQPLSKFRPPPRPLVDQMRTFHHVLPRSPARTAISPFRVRRFQRWGAARTKFDAGPALPR